MEKLAILGGTPAIVNPPIKKLFNWPIITQEDENAALDVIRNNSFSGIDITKKFQDEFAEWIGTKHAVAYCNGTMALAATMFAIGLGKGDEIICPTKTYWASILQATSFGASAVFCNIDETLCIDPDDIERCISPATKAIMVVHYSSCPCDMDRIMAIAKKHNLYVIEDVSHAQGGFYKGRRLGTIGDIAGMSLMSQKSFSAGELGIVVTNNRRLYERSIAYGHYERNNEENIIESDELKPYFHMSLGAVKGRANQLCTAIARVQLKYYDERCAEVRRAMNYFCDLIENIPGINPIRVDESTGSNMAGWYAGKCIYKPEFFHGLPVEKFAEALNAEGVDTYANGNYCLHTHEYFRSFDLFSDGAPTRIAYNNRDVRELDKLCRPSEQIFSIGLPLFRSFDKEWIEKYATAFRKVAENHQQLLSAENNKNAEGQWYGKV